ncbi:MAG: hypothetical protein B7Y84_19525, partial [Azorhizobium sp. 32-67-21]
GIIEAFVSDPPWDPDSFPDDAALTAKFSALAGPVLGADETQRLAGTILSLSRAPVARLA